jgi:hypothetical protein
MPGIMRPCLRRRNRWFLQERSFRGEIHKLAQQLYAAGGGRNEVAASNSTTGARKLER